MNDVQADRVLLGAPDLQAIEFAFRQLRQAVKRKAIALQWRRKTLFQSQTLELEVANLSQEGDGIRNKWNGASLFWRTSQSSLALSHFLKIQCHNNNDTLSTVVDLFAENITWMAWWNG